MNLPNNYKSPEFLRECGNYKSPNGTKHGKCLWKCYCGNEFEALAAHIKSGNTKSCGCLWELYMKERTEKSIKGHPLYQFYWNMIARCHYPKHPSYKKYFNKGIEVCDHWRESFENFRNDMEDGYSPGLSLDRIKNNLGYFKENCRWVTTKIQGSNRDSVKKYLYNGKIYNASELSVELGGSKNLLMGRIKSGMSLQDAIAKPIRKRLKHNENNGKEK